MVAKSQLPVQSSCTLSQLDRQGRAIKSVLRKLLCKKMQVKGKKGQKTHIMSEEGKLQRDWEKEPAVVKTA